MECRKQEKKYSTRQSHLVGFICTFSNRLNIIMYGRDSLRVRLDFMIWITWNLKYRERFSSKVRFFMLHYWHLPIPTVLQTGKLIKQNKHQNIYTYKFIIFSARAGVISFYRIWWWLCQHNFLVGYFSLIRFL